MTLFGNISTHFPQQENIKTQYKLSPVFYIIYYERT